MKPLDVDKLADALIRGAQRYIDRMVEPVLQRLAQIEASPAAPSAEDMARMVATEVERAVEAIPRPTDGKDADPAETARLVHAEVAKAIVAIEIPPGEPGKSVTLEDVRPLVEAAVAEAVGKAVSAAVSEAVKGIPVPQIPPGYAKALIDRDGSLVLTRTDGSTENVGVVAGRDADMDALKAEVVKLVEAIPRPRDGEDGVGFDDMDIVLSDDERTLTISAEKGERKREWSFRLSHVVDRGVWQQNWPGGYQKGDGVTWGGQFWIATEDTELSPDLSKDGRPWRLAVRKGRDARNQAKVA